MTGNEKNGASELPQHSGREGERGIAPDRQIEVDYEEIEGTERAYLVLNFCSNKTYINMDRRNCQEVYRTYFLFFKREGALLRGRMCIEQC